MGNFLLIGETSGKLEINYFTKRMEGLRKIDHWWNQRTLNKCLKIAGFKEIEYIKPVCHPYA